MFLKKKNTQRRKPLHGRLISRSDVKARSAVPDIKKRHVELMTRLPTERLATACWAFIVAKTSWPKPAPLLVYRPLLGSNMKIYPQSIHRFGVARSGVRVVTRYTKKSGVKVTFPRSILVAAVANRARCPCEVRDH